MSIRFVYFLVTVLSAVMIYVIIELCAFSLDVYSYDEDKMVEDPYLARHLAHFGINIAALEKVLSLVSTMYCMTFFVLF